MPLSRSLAEVFGAHGDAIKNDIRKVLPATVTAVHLATQTVDVQIAVNNPLFDELGNVVTEPAPSISEVPLGVLRGGGFMVWVPVAVGDSVLLVFSDLSTDTWRAGDGTPKDPGWVGHHTFDSPFALPMVAPDAKVFANPATDGAAKVLIGKDGSPAQIRISATDIELGNNALDAIALASKVDTMFAGASTLATAVSTFAGVVSTYAGAIAAIADPTATATPTLVTGCGALAGACSTFSGIVAPSGSTLVKAQ